MSAQDTGANNEEFSPSLCINCQVICNVNYNTCARTRITSRMVRICKANFPECLQKMLTNNRIFNMHAHVQSESQLIFYWYNSIPYICI